MKENNTHRTGNKIITGGRGRERLERGGGRKEGAGTGIAKDWREVQKEN